MIYGYARVSTKGQARDGNSFEEQEAVLRANGASEIFMEAYTGAEGDRPELRRLVDALQPGDTFMVTKMDRFARNTQDALRMIQDFRERGVKLHILNMGVADNTPMGMLMSTILAAFAEYERAMIIERTQAGKAIAREKPGFREGRPPVDVDVERLEEIKARVAAGECSKAQAARELGIGRTTWYRIAG